MTANANEMTALDIARRFLELGQAEDSCHAYEVALHAQEELSPADKLECALAVLQLQGDYTRAYDALKDLYNQGEMKEDILALMTEAFYLPNVNQLKNRYEKNCKKLKKYPYLFRKDFVPFEELPILFFPYDDNGFLPFYITEERFGDYVDFHRPVISRNFFHDLDKPILAADVFSQYELEYLNDNVRKSEWVAKENHIYLHYTDWAVFCAYLQCLDWRALLKDEKFVLLMEDEVSQYPIDFKARFGLDYTQCDVQPIDIREVHRVIWHTQLSAHNGGDFFNEIFHGHPNLLMMELMFDSAEHVIASSKEFIRKTLDPREEPCQITITLSNNEFAACEDSTFLQYRLTADDPGVQRLLRLKDRTDKDILVDLFFRIAASRGVSPDPAQRIAPVILFQPHFHSINYTVSAHESGAALLESEEYDKIVNAPIWSGFKYVKTFTPMRRPTTSYAASVRFIWNNRERELRANAQSDQVNKLVVVKEPLIPRILNRSFMTDPEQRLFQDSVLVRFEDGKLNPTATFTALAAFLDLPYTHSMTYCSNENGIDPEAIVGNARGFDPVTVYRTYDEFANDSERCYLEYLMRDAYEQYGYDFHYYDGKPMNEDRIKALVDDFTTINGFISGTRNPDGSNRLDELDYTPEEKEDLMQEISTVLQEYTALRNQVARVLDKNLTFVNRQGRPLRMLPLLKLDPALLEQPLYH